MSYTERGGKRRVFVARAIEKVIQGTESVFVYGSGFWCISTWCVSSYLGSWSGCPDGLWARGWVAEWRWGGCSAGRVRGRKAWTRWWRTDCCWSPAGLAPEGDPGGAGGVDAGKHGSEFIDNSHVTLYSRWLPLILQLVLISFYIVAADEQHGKTAGLCFGREKKKKGSFDGMKSGEHQ